MFEKFIEIEDIKYFKSDIEKMDGAELHMFCSFLNESELRWVQKHCFEGFKHKIDNILFKI